MELAAKAGALRQMLLELLEHPEDIRKMTIMGRTCNIRRADGSIECSLPLDQQYAEGGVLALLFTKMWQTLMVRWHWFTAIT